MESVEGKVAVVTGGASGIGRALAQRFLADGAQVVLADVEEGALDATAAALGDEHGADRVLAVPTDVRDAEAVDALADAAFARFGAAHVVCNNAGVGVGGLAWEVPADRWRWIVEVNLLGVANGIRSFVPRLITQGEGHVVNTASAAGLVTGYGMAPYYATKHGVVALSEALHFDLGLVGANVEVSVVCPEWVRTRILLSERNRPEGVSRMPGVPDPGADGEDGAEAESLGEQLVAGGIDPADVADQVAEAIRVGRFWVLTHPTTLPNAQQRWDAIAADGQPVFWDVMTGSTGANDPPA